MHDFSDDTPSFTGLMLNKARNARASASNSHTQRCVAARGRAAFDAYMLRDARKPGKMRHAARAKADALLYWPQEAA